MMILGSVHSLRCREIERENRPDAEAKETERKNNFYGVSIYRDRDRERLSDHGLCLSSISIYTSLYISILSSTGTLGHKP